MLAGRTGWPLLRSFTGAGHWPLGWESATLTDVLRTLGVGECSQRWCHWDSEAELEKCSAGSAVGFIRCPPLGMADGNRDANGNAE